MSKYLLVGALVALAACGEKKADMPAAEPAAAAAPETPAPATADSMAKPDSAMASDTSHSM